MSLRLLTALRPRAAKLLPGVLLALISLLPPPTIAGDVEQWVPQLVRRLDGAGTSAQAGAAVAAAGDSTATAMPTSSSAHQAPRAAPAPMSARPS